jgi:hypothetical protein
MSIQIMPHINYEYLFDFFQENIVRKHNQDGTFLDVRFFINSKKIASLFGETLNSLENDLLDIALACYVADRLSLRQNKNQRLFQWTRSFKLKIAVRAMDIWSSDKIKENLSKLLQFLTDDLWGFEFVACKKQQNLTPIQGKLFPPLDLPGKVALYSGGLDSFAGSVQEVSNFPDHSFVFVSGTTNSRQKSAQAKQVKAIKALSLRGIHHVVFPFGIKWGKGPRYKEEPSQRTRGFLFLTLGVITALKAGIKTLHIYENGIGAINLPYDASQNGTMNSRSTNPLFIMKMESFLNKILGEPFQIINPFLFQTKGDMCKHESVQAMAQIIPLTFSCDGFPVRTAGKSQCGFCTSCLLRRLSLEAAGLANLDDGDRYIADLLFEDFSGSKKQLSNLKSMEWQYQKLSQRLVSENKWHNLAVEFPMLETLIAEINSYKIENVEALQKAIIQLYERYISEWQNFSARQRLHLKTKAA